MSTTVNRLTIGFGILFPTALTEKFDDMKNFMKAIDERIVVLEEARQKQPEPESLRLPIG